MHHIKRRYEAWWEKYDYLLSSGIEAGIAFIHHHLLLSEIPQQADFMVGNNVSHKGWDHNMSKGYLNATLHAPEGYFGPRVGHFP